MFIMHVSDDVLTCNLALIVNEHLSSFFSFLPFPCCRLLLILSVIIIMHHSHLSRFVYLIFSVIIEICIII